MAKDRIQQKDVIDPKIIPTFAALNKQLATSVKLVSDLAKSATNLSKAFDPKNIQDVTKSTEEYNDVNEKSQKENKKAISIEEKRNKQLASITESEEKHKLALQKKRKEIQENIKAEKAQSGSINDLSKKNKILRERVRNVSTETEKGRKRILAYNKVIDKNSKTITKASDKLVKQKINIGNYSSALGGLPGGFGNAARGAQQFGTMLKALTAIPLILIIVGILAALKGLVALFKSTDDGGTRLEATMNGLKAVLQIMKNVMLELIEGTKARFERFGKRWQLLKAQIKGNDEQVAILRDEIQQLTAQIQGNNPFENIAERAKAAFKAVSDLTFQMDSLNDRMIAAISSQALLELEMEKQITLSADLTRSDTERIAALEKALEATKKFFGKRKEFAEETFNREIEIEAARREVSAETIKQLILMDDVQAENARKNNEDIARVWNESGDDRIKALEEMYVEFITADIDYQKKTKRIITQLSGLQKRAAKDAVETQKVKYEELNELDAEQVEIEIEAQDEKLTSLQDAEIEKLQERLDKIKELNEQEKEDQEALDEAKKASTQAYIAFAINAAGSLSNSIFGFLDNQLNAELAADIKKAESRGASVAEIEKIEKDAAKKKQKRSIIEAIINTALGVTAALANPGGILGIVIAALAAIAGAIEIATISSQSFAKGVKDTGTKGMIATVGEIGTERINYADGTSMLTPSKSTQMYLPPHSEVIPNRILQQDLAEMQAINKPSKSRENEQRRKEEHRELIRAIKNRDETNINITEGGFAVTAKIGMDRIKYIDRNYRS